MEEKQKPLPAWLRIGLKKYDIEPDDVTAWVKSDISTDGGLCDTYCLLMADAIALVTVKPPARMLFSGAGISGMEESGEEISGVCRYPLEQIETPRVLDQVVGGLFTVKINKVETWLCRFTGTRMREMQRFCKQLERVTGAEKDSDQDKGPARGNGGHGEEPRFCPKCGHPYPESGRMVCPKCMKHRTVFMRVLTYYAEYKLRIAVLMLCIMVSGAMTAITPYLTGTILYDKVLERDGQWAEALGFPEKFFFLLLSLVMATVVIRVVQQITGVIHGRMTAYIVPGAVKKIKDAVFTSLQRLSISFFTRRQTGSLMQRVNKDANEIMHFFIDGLPYFIYNIFSFVFAAVVMLRTDWRLAAASLVLLPPLFYVSYKLLPRFWHAHGRRSRAVRSMYALLNDGITGARVVRAFGQEQTENARFDKANNRVRDAEIRVVKYGNRFDVAYTAAREIPNLLVWMLGALIIIYMPGQLVYGELVTFINYLAMMQGPMMFFSSMFRWWAGSMNAAQRVFEIIDATPDVVESNKPIKLDIKGEISFRGVNFGYETNKPVLKDVSFEVRAGEMLGIVGKSGAGKSTLVNLLSRLYDPDSGVIMLDGHDIREVSFESLRGAVAMVSQETYIFIGTVAENIAYSRPDASHDEIVAAAKAASAHSFICRLPDGYDTVIGAGGRDLSGGERQRLSIARAILANPKILVLDEATASVDTQTERAIQASIDLLVKDRTTISIAHRLSTLRGADRLIVLDNGKIAESGTHSELIEQEGEYFKLLELQTKALAMRGFEE